MTIGVLSFHGDFAEHLDALNTMSVRALEVRSPEDLSHCDKLIIPGGESTVMSRFLKLTGVGEAIKHRAKEGTIAIYGTCAGAIILSKEAKGKNAPETLGLMDIVIQRNAYGPQTESFEKELRIVGFKEPVPVAFIRAPIIEKTGKDVEILAREGENPVLVRQERMLAGTFHPEVRTGNTAIHEMFLRM